MSIEQSFENERTRARKKALVLLTDMDRTEAQLLEKLQKAGFSEAACEDAIRYVKGFGYVDDVRYADHYIEIRKQNYSRRRISNDLTEKKKLSRQEVYDAMERAGDWDERPLIRRLAEKKLRNLDLTDPADYRRVTAYLARQGFSASDIYAVMDELREES
ncbi:MAG: regulatory protein RecX [Lachnospiraceae bacterium]|nr:regulatory protein RecX [Lachnospiraceae bacterium]